MEKWYSKSKGKPRASSDESAIVKAAAWAWYQHGPGSDGKPIREYTVTSRNTRGHYKPSRYKLEAMKTRDHENDDDHDEDQSLFDNYEIQRISKKLDELIECEKGVEKKKKKKKKRWRGLWERPRVTCGAREDVVESCRKCAAGKG